MNKILDENLEFELYKDEYFINHEKIKEILERHNFSNYEFCKLCQIPLTIIDSVLAGDTNISIRYLFAVAETFGIPLESLNDKKRVL